MPSFKNSREHEMAVRVKICGLLTEPTLDCALDAGADYVGLMFYPPSPRCIDFDTAARLADMARGRAKVVAVTVDADDELVETIRARVAPDLLQAHGSETPQRVADITARFGLPVMKVIKVADSEDVQSARDYADVAAMIMFDAKAPASLANALPGGNGLAFDWTLLGGDGAPRDFMLGGGLDALNVAAAIAASGAPIVDVSSGVESEPGKKDCTLIRKFIEAVKAAG